MIRPFGSFLRGPGAGEQPKTHTACVRDGRAANRAPGARGLFSKAPSSCAPGVLVFRLRSTAWRNTSNAARDLMCRNGGKGGR